MKSLKTILGIALSVGGLGTAATVTGVSIAQADRAVVDSQVEAAGGYSCSEIIISDTLGWNIRTLWLDNFSYSTGYSKTDFTKFCETYYNSSISSWNKEGTTRGWKNSNNGFNLCAGGSSGTYSFLLPSWVEYCSINIENNSNSRSVGYLNNVLQYSNNSGSVMGSAKDKTVTFESKNWNNALHFQASIGSAKTTTDFESSVTFIAKTDASTEIARKTETVNKFEHVGDYSISGYTFVAWYTNSNLTTSFSGLIASNTTLYAKFNKLDDPSASTNSFYVYDPHTILGNTFANINVYGYGQSASIKPMSWPGTHSGVSQVTLGRTSMYQVALSTSYPNFVMNCGDKQNQTVDVTNLSSNIGNVLVIDNTQTSGKYNVHWDNPEVYSNVPATDGYYLLGDDDFVTATGGSGTSWKYATGVKMNTLSGEGNKANYVLTVNKSVKFRARSYLNSTDSWLSFGTTYDGTDGITTSGDNVQVAAGTYSIYVNENSLVYVAKGIPLDAFCSTFLTDVANTCDVQTGNTDPNTLHTLWGDLATLYNGVTADGKAEIVAITFNGGSDADDPHKVVKAYHYIVTKYGTTVCPDFIWGKNYNPASANKVSTNNSANNSASAIIAASAAISLTAVGAFFILRKKKHN
jgi:hypothetical protein